MTTNINLPNHVNYIINQLNACGYSAYVVGGSVRDTLLNAQPYDYDVATSASPHEVCQCFSHLRVIETGIKHGTVTLICEANKVEVTTYRTDGSYIDHRHPSNVNFTQSLYEDLSRRDFTINALAYHPVDGLIDHYGGVQDIKQGIIRCVGEPSSRFDEDALRILRGLRFASCLAFSIETNTAKAMRAKKALLANLSAERVRDEFCRILVGGNAKQILTQYVDVLAIVFPYLQQVNNNNEQRAMYDTTIDVVTTCDCNVTLRLAAFMCSISQMDNNEQAHLPKVAKKYSSADACLAEMYLSKLRFDNLTIKSVAAVIEASQSEFNTHNGLKTLLRVYSPTISLLALDLRLAKATAKRDSGEIASITQMQATMKSILQENQCYSLTQLAINGCDLGILGIQGRKVGIVLNALLDEVIDGTLANQKEALLAKAKQMVNNCP